MVLYKQNKESKMKNDFLEGDLVYIPQAANIYKLVNLLPFTDPKWSLYWFEESTSPSYGMVINGEPQRINYLKVYFLDNRIFKDKTGYIKINEIREVKKEKRNVS
jgi:hypothetical protein